MAAGPAAPLFSALRTAKILPGAGAPRADPGPGARAALGLGGALADARRVSGRPQARARWPDRGAWPGPSRRSSGRAAAPGPEGGGRVAAISASWRAAPPPRTLSPHPPSPSPRAPPPPPPPHPALVTPNPRPPALPDARPPARRELTCPPARPPAGSAPPCAALLGSRPTGSSAGAAPWDPAAAAAAETAVGAVAEGAGPAPAEAAGARTLTHAHARTRTGALAPGRT